jgi:two-component system, cell cycle response regulator DivK
MPHLADSAGAMLKTRLELHIPILALSAHALVGEREKAFAAGCDAFDAKPIQFERLLATLRRLGRAASDGAGRS